MLYKNIKADVSEKARSVVTSNSPVAEGLDETTVLSAGLVRITWTFHTTDDNKDHDTIVSTSCDNTGLLLGAGDVGGGEEWGDNSTRVVGIPVANAASWESCASGNINIIERPNGDDEWHFDVSLFLEFEFGAWRRINWTGINLAEDRPQFHGFWS